MDLNQIATATGGTIIAAASKTKSHIVYMKDGIVDRALRLEDLPNIFKIDAPHCIINTSKHKAYFFWEKGVVTETDYLKLEKYARKAVSQYTGIPDAKKDLSSLLLGGKVKIDGVPVSIFSSVGYYFRSSIYTYDKQIRDIELVFDGGRDSKGKSRFMKDIKYSSPFDVLPIIFGKS